MMMNSLYEISLRKSRKQFNRKEDVKDKNGYVKTHDHVIQVKCGRRDNNIL